MIHLLALERCGRDTLSLSLSLSLFLSLSRLPTLMLEYILVVEQGRVHSVGMMAYANLTASVLLVCYHDVAILQVSLSLCLSLCSSLILLSFFTPAHLQLSSFFFLSLSLSDYFALAPARLLFSFKHVSLISLINISLIPLPADKQSFK